MEAGRGFFEHAWVVPGGDVYPNQRAPSHSFVWSRFPVCSFFGRGWTVCSFLALGQGGPVSTFGTCALLFVACFLFPCGGVCTYLPLQGAPLPSGRLYVVCSAGADYLWLWDVSSLHWGQGEPVSTLGMRVRRVVFLCVPLLQWMCAWEEGACVFSCVWGGFCAVRGWLCLSPVGLVLFLGVLVGDLRRFFCFLVFPGGVCAPTPKSPPSHSIGFARVRGRCPVCSAVCVLFARWGA